MRTARLLPRGHGPKLLLWDKDTVFPTGTDRLSPEVAAMRLFCLEVLKMVSLLMYARGCFGALDFGCYGLGGRSRSTQPSIYIRDTLCSISIKTSIHFLATSISGETLQGSIEIAKKSL